MTTGGKNGSSGRAGLFSGPKLGFSGKQQTLRHFFGLGMPFLVLGRPAFGPARLRRQRGGRPINLRHTY